MPATIKSDFEVVRRNKVYEEVAKQIERLILKKLKPGDKLPAERELAELLRVSRSSVRDAIRGLELKGLVEPRQGAGTIVRETSAELVGDPFTNALKRRRELVSELLDFRKMLEPPLAARAATHATVDQISEMEEILQRQEGKQAQGDAAVAEDAEFHYSIALASDNSVVLKVILPSPTMSTVAWPLPTRLPGGQAASPSTLSSSSLASQRAGTDVSMWVPAGREITSRLNAGGSAFGWVGLRYVDA